MLAPHAPRRDAIQVTGAVLADDRPTLFQLNSDDAPAPRLGGARVTDRYADEWLAELCIVRNPSVDFRSLAGLDFMRAFVTSRNRKSDGTWVYFPWRHELTHILGREEFLDLVYSRNHPCIDRLTQAVLGSIKVGVAGLSVGSSIARALAMTGVQHLRIADFDAVAPSNKQPSWCAQRASRWRTESHNSRPRAVRIQSLHRPASLPCGRH